MFGMFQKKEREVIEVFKKKTTRLNNTETETPPEADFISAYDDNKKVLCCKEGYEVLEHKTATDCQWFWQRCKCKNYKKVWTVLYQGSRFK